MAVNTVAVKIPKDVFDGVKARLPKTEFKCVDEYVTYVLRQVLSEVEGRHETAYSREDEEKVKERLRALGYLD